MAPHEDSSLLNILDDRLHSSAGNSTSLRHRKPNLAASHTSRRSNITRASRRRKSRSFLRRTWALPLLLILTFFVLYVINPTESNIVLHFIFLSYKLKSESDNDSVEYGKGLWDVAFVCFYTIFLSFAREFIMHELLRPLARLCGIRSRGKQSRFMEQMYVAVYIAFIGPLGVYCMKRTPVWYFNTRGMYEAFPHRTHCAELKFYYLFQAAFWTQQALVMLLGMEKKRKDYKELVVHHIVTIALIGLSYRFHFTYMGFAVYITHDISDFFLAISKSLNYIGSPLQGPSFSLCIIMWTYLRHYLNLRILYSILTEFSTVGPYGLDWETEQYKCFLSKFITFALLAALQALNLFWLYCLLRNAYRFIFLGIAKDDRSEDEETELTKMRPEKEITSQAEAVPFLNDKGAYIQASKGTNNTQ
ncbi:longevity assurance proteins LAG1/LAC1 [Hypoxylon sp. NC0597]|nr:longevity assurance proteins LAG1/LAC1 [Hypoxylon sp. NC0597]